VTTSPADPERSAGESSSHAPSLGPESDAWSTDPKGSGAGTIASPVRMPLTPLLVGHGLTCLAVAGGRLLHPGDAPAEPLKAIRIRAPLLLHGSAYRSGPDRLLGLRHPPERFAERNHRPCELPATPLPRFPSRARNQRHDRILVSRRRRAAYR
jgi:hypothetical protein